MPIQISQELPAYTTLQKENIFVMTDDRAKKQDIRPLKIVILNLMPKKIETETQIMRLLSNTPLQVQIELLHVASHVSKNTPLNHLSNFYTTFDKVKENLYDGMIITGAPVEHLQYEDVDYWEEMCEILEWSTTNVFSTMHICWGSQAALYHHFGIPKYSLDKKMFGVYSHRITRRNSQLLKGFDDEFLVPHSRNTEIRMEDVIIVPNLDVLAESEQAGIHIIANRNGRQYFIMGHCEYDVDTLANEYFRDVEKGIELDVPFNYFPEDNPQNEPIMKWCGNANLLFSNWLNYCVYQRTPYNLNDLKK